MTDARPAQERRKATRKRCLFRGRVLFNDNIRTLDCMVRNLSDGGALIETEALTILPAGFRLAIDARRSLSAGLVRWHEPGKFGVELRESA